VVALTHGMGCATDSDGEELQVLRRTLGGYARHANFAAVLVVGLGCETNQIQGLIAQEGLQEGALLQTFNIQDTGGTAKTVARGVELIQRDAAEANRCSAAGAGQPPHRRPAVRRQRRLLRHQRQPGAGRGGRPLVRHGGTAILSETPEIYGGEHLLTRRAVSARGGRQAARAHPLVGAYTARNGMQMDNNPSAGNKAGGLTTILEKSLGAIAKSGTTNLVDVYEYAEPVTARGFVYMDTPGLRPGVGHRPGGRRRQPDLLHHRPRLGLRLRALAVAQAVHQHRAVAEAGRRHRHQLRRHRRRLETVDDGRAHLPS
jgi:altronate hydrolase